MFSFSSFRRSSLFLLATAGLGVVSFPTTASAETFSLGCTGGEEFDAGLCYELCEEGYDPVGPVCWESCAEDFTDDGAFCRKDAVITAKETYTRGAGTVLGCPEGSEQDGALCYQACDAGYTGVGPVCWQQCAAGFTDTGAFCQRDVVIISADTDDCAWYDVCGVALDAGCSHCPDGYINDGCTCRQDAYIYAKNTYTRGVGDAISACAAGEEQDGALCYPVCDEGYDGVGPVCWQSCPEGFTDDGAFCRKDAIITAKDSYGRGAGSVPPMCTSESFDEALPAPSDEEFTMIIASDTQLPWFREGKDPTCTTDECILETGIRTNKHLVAAMNGITSLGSWPAAVSGGAVTEPKGIIINGDLTAYWHEWQYDLFSRFYLTPGALNYPLFLGLGNHDYDNNVDDCWWEEEPSYLVYGSNGCANNAVDFIKGMLGCEKVPGFDASKVDSFDEDSLAYSFNLGDYHFVQLHNYVSYERDSLGVESSADWLVENLEKATDAGFKTVINLHDFDTDVPDQALLDALDGQSVVALFAAHLHWEWGKLGVIPGTSIPFFRSGAAEYEKFLLVKFGKDAMTVGVVDSSTGAPSFEATTNGKDLDTYRFADFVEPEILGRLNNRANLGASEGEGLRDEAPPPAGTEEEPSSNGDEATEDTPAEETDDAMTEDEGPRDEPSNESEPESTGSDENDAEPGNVNADAAEMDDSEENHNDTSESDEPSKEVDLAEAEASEELEDETSGAEASDGCSVGRTKHGISFASALLLLGLAALGRRRARAQTALQR